MAAHCFFDLKSLEKRNSKCFLFEDIIEKTEAIFKLRMENTKVCLNSFTKSVYEIRCTILEKNRDYFEAIVKDISLSLISQRQNKENFDIKKTIAHHTLKCVVCYSASFLGYGKLTLLIAMSSA